MKYAANKKELEEQMEALALALVGYELTGYLDKETAIDGRLAITKYLELYGGEYD